MKGKMESAAEGSITSDVELVADLAARETAGLGVLYARPGAKLYHIALRILRNRDEAEDAVHDVFVSLPERAVHYRPASGSVRSWLSAITRNDCIDRIRRTRRRAASNAVV